MKQTLKKMTALFLSLALLIGLVPVNASAANYAETDEDYYSVVSQKDWELAPGIVESEIVLNNDAKDRRQVMHVVEVDVNNEYTKVIPSTKNMIPTSGKYGVQTMDKQAAYAEENGYGDVVAAMNISLSWYNSTYYDEHPELVGEPLGYLILDGVQYTNSQGKTSGAQTCLVINFDEKDGEARPADIPKTQMRSTSDPITGWEEQVIPANFGFLVKDGKMVNTKEEHTSEGASRSMLGIKEDGTIVMVMNDGRQAPYSTGFNSYEMSEAILKLGCVYAINGDGGGSSQFLSQRPGEELKVNCSPSDGALRATTHGVLVITTAPSTGEFVRAHVEAEHEYYTPGSSVEFTAIGADLAGKSAEIPAGATWEISDNTMGTIDDNGVFVSSGKTGEVTAKLMYEGEQKGSTTINIVIPDAIAFGDAAAYTVPFGESITLNVTGTYGVYDVSVKADDYTLSVENTTLGTLDGNKYIAGETAGTTNLTVSLNADTSISKTIPLTIGKGSEVIFSFEEGTEGADLNNWEIKDHEGKYTTYTDLAIVDSENGMVHNGETSLAVHMPSHTRINGGEGYTANSITWVGDRILLENATAIGMWIYIPEEATQTEIALNYVWYNDQGVQQRTTPDLCLNDDFNGNEYSGWHYLSVPISKSEAYIEDATAVAASQGYKRNFFLKFYVTNSGNAGDESSYMGDITYYIDDVTVDYSDAVADRIAPVFSSTYAKDINAENDTTLTSGTNVVMNSGELNFNAQISDNVSIDASTARVSVDGKEISATYRNGRITSADVELNDGVHRIVFEIADTMGNVSKAVRYITVKGEDIEIQIVPQKPEAEVAYTGSVYWVDVVADEAEKVDSITMKIDTDTMHNWELDNAVLVNGYDMEYSFASDADEKDNMVTVTLTNKGSDVTGNAVVASLPIRVWSYCGTESGADYTPAEAWTKGSVTAVSVNVEVEQGKVVYKDTTSSTFSAEKMHLDTEAYIHQYKMDKTYFANNTYHVHTESILEDKEATCTESGYAGRTYCEACDSVVDWGTKDVATGHSFGTKEGLVSCGNCDVTYYYVNGEAQTGWVELADKYYYFAANGEAVDGSATVDGHTYTFTDHVLTDGAWEVTEEGYTTCWWAGKKLENTWFTIGDKTYHFTRDMLDVGIMGIHLRAESGANLGIRYYVFDENGVWLENYTGFYTDGKEACWSENGVAVYAGVVQDSEGNYYYMNSKCLAVKNCTYSIGAAKTNGLVPAGKYEFNAEGKMVNPPVVEPDTPEDPEVKNGLMKDDDGEIRYYENGVAVYKGLVQDSEGNYYYINSGKKAVKNCTYSISAGKTNGLVPAGKYEFNAEGKMVNPPVVEPDTPEDPEVKNGLMKDDDGEIRYYENGVAVYKGLVQDSEGNYYYINSGKKAVKNCTYSIGTAKTNGLLPAGKYEFDAEGKMVQ